MGASRVPEPSSRIGALARRVLDEGYEIPRAEALAVLCAPDADVYELCYWANRIRRMFKRDVVQACSIISVKTGACSEDCAFCAQSAHYQTPSPQHGFVPAAEVQAAAEAARQMGSFALGVVASGRGPDGSDLETCCRYLDAIGAAGGVARHLSVGLLDEAQIARLKAHGLQRAHHNLETSRRFFPRICTTHSYDERLATLHALRRQGVEICSGGLFGMGEDWEDRVDLALELREVEAVSVPLNFLHPIPGTPLASAAPLAPFEILRLIALYRFLLFSRDISVCGGREVNLRDVQSWIFLAGANAFMLGNYLTTTGRDAAQDRQMLRDLGLVLQGG